MPSLVSLGGITGTYNSTAPVLVNGQAYGFQLDANGNIIVTLGTTIAGEDLVNNILVVEHRYLYRQVNNDTLIKSGAGFLHTVTFSQADAAPTAGSITLYDNTAESGTIIFAWGSGTTGITTAVFMPFSLILDVSFSTGLFVGFNTTSDVLVTVSYR